MDMSHLAELKSHLWSFFEYEGLQDSSDLERISLKVYGQGSNSWPRGYKTFFVLNSAEHEIYPAHKC